MPRKQESIQFASIAFYQETDGQRSLLVRAHSAEATLAKYEKFQQGKYRKEILGVNGRTIAALL